MTRAFLMAMGLAALCVPAAGAEEFVPSFIDAVFGAPDGSSVTKTFGYAVGVPKADLGSADCAKSLGTALDAWVDYERTQLGNEKMTFLYVTCRAAGDKWVRIVQRVPAQADTASSVRGQ
jgi:hypothetical protein